MTTGSGDGRRFLNEREAAEILRVSPYTLRNWRAFGGGPPFIRLSATKGVRYDSVELLTWARSRGIDPENER